MARRLPRTLSTRLEHRGANPNLHGAMLAGGLRSPQQACRPAPFSHSAGRSHGMQLRLAGESATMSLYSGGSPSRSTVPATGSDSRLAAKARAAAKDKGRSSAGQRRRRMLPAQGPGLTAPRCARGTGLQAPAPADLKCDHNETVASRPAHLWGRCSFALRAQRSAAPECH